MNGAATPGRSGKRFKFFDHTLENNVSARDGQKDGSGVRERPVSGAIGRSDTEFCLEYHFNVNRTPLGINAEARSGHVNFRKRRRIRLGRTEKDVPDARLCRARYSPLPAKANAVARDGPAAVQAGARVPNEAAPLPPRMESSRNGDTTIQRRSDRDPVTVIGPRNVDPPRAPRVQRP